MHLNATQKEWNQEEYEEKARAKVSK